MTTEEKVTFQFGYSRRRVTREEGQLLEKQLRDLCPMPDYQAACELARTIKGHMTRPEQHSTVVSTRARSRCCCGRSS